MNPDALPRSTRVARIITTAELTAAGWSDGRIRRLVERGVLLPVSRGAYADATRAQTLLGKKGGAELLAVAAAAAVSGPGAVVSHQSAAVVHSIDLIGQRTTGQCGTTVHITRPPERGWTARAGIRPHGALLPASHVVGKLDMLVTTPARTVVDLARTLSFREAVVAADSALQRKLTTKDELSAVAGECARRTGIGRVAAVVAFADRRAESALESIARVAFADCGLPPPDLQVWLGWGAEPIGRVDFYWKKYRTIAEVDGALKYADPERARAQLKRDSYLRGQGFEVVHFEWDDIVSRPDTAAATLREAFRRSERLAAGPHHRSASRRTGYPAALTVYAPVSRVPGYPHARWPGRKSDAIVVRSGDLN